MAHLKVLAEIHKIVNLQISELRISTNNDQKRLTDFEPNHPSSCWFQKDRKFRRNRAFNTEYRHSKSSKICFVPTIGISCTFDDKESENGNLDKNMMAKADGGVSYSTLSAFCPSSSSDGGGIEVSVCPAQESSSMKSVCLWQKKITTLPNAFFSPKSKLSPSNRVSNLVCWLNHRPFQYPNDITCIVALIHTRSHRDLAQLRTFSLTRWPFLSI